MITSIICDSSCIQNKMYNTQRIYLAAGSIMGVSVAVYLVYRYTKTNGTFSNSAEIKTSRPARIEVRIPRKYAASVIGRGGSSIRAIEQSTKSKIILKKELETEDFRFLEIRGAPENAQKAETMILEILQTQSEKETQEIFIPRSDCGKVIGKNGQTIRMITNASKAIIKVDSEPMNEQGQHKVAITGTREEIENAKSMIYQSISSTTKVLSKSLGASSRNHLKHVCAILGLREGLVEVFVSAMESPSRFWIQVLGSRSLDLDNLVRSMTNYYAVHDNCMLHQLRGVSVGQLVAAHFGGDGKWYRAKVMQVLDNESRVVLFYLDYGDTAKAAAADVLALDVQFLKLHFQAIECTLASAKPHSGEWTVEEKHIFRTLCQVAQWKTLEAEVMNLPDLKFEEDAEMILYVELYDRINGKRVSLSEEITKKRSVELS